MQAGRMACCVVRLHSSGRELNLGLKSFNYYPSPHPFTPQHGKTCRPTLPIGTLAEGRHTHIQHTP